ncbi:hypothetical protein MO387_17150 [Shewanella sp. N2AIL]|uniref:hypothetical protein n=1 Tax=Shewanella sp. N2AIL TaxID=2926851 RepID=UPI001F5882FB|nr:hypothetical protein [Shewanella sp. N2AIL]MCI2964799.1 hypothetical protein [Shewanella sp. N2AIL]
MFKKTFSLLNDSLGDTVFKRWDGNSFGGKFLMSLYETIAFGISQNLHEIESKGREEQKAFVVARAKALWSDDVFEKNSGAGIRGTTRLSKLLPMAKGFFKP